MGGIELSGCGSFVRWLFIFFNIPVLLVGLAALGIGIWQIVVDNNLNEVLSEDYSSAAAILIASGVFAIALAIIGVIGALFKWRIFLIVYLAVIFLVVVLEIAAVGYSFAKADDIDREVIEQDLRRALDRYYSSNDTTNHDSNLNDVVDFIQERLECCGITNSSDWLTSPYYIQENRLPSSCCDQDEPNVCATVHVFGEGCRDAFTDFVEDNVYAIVIAGLVFAAFQLLLVVMSFYLFMAVNNALVLTRA